MPDVEELVIVDAVGASHSSHQNSSACAVNGVVTDLVPGNFPATAIHVNAGFVTTVDDVVVHFVGVAAKLDTIEDRRYA